jgi:hypothetical protein
MGFSAGMEPHTIVRMISTLQWRVRSVVSESIERTSSVTHPVHMNRPYVSQVMSERAVRPISLVVLIAAHIPVLQWSQPTFHLCDFTETYRLPQPSSAQRARRFRRSVLSPQTNVTGNNARKKSMAACMLAPYIEKLLCTLGFQHLVCALASSFQSAAGSSHCRNVNRIMRMVLTAVKALAI